MTEEKSLTIANNTKPVALETLDINDLGASLNYVREVFNKTMTKSVHYGIVLGASKPCLLKPGAEVLCLAFGLVPKFESEERELGDQHLEVLSKCFLYTRSGILVGQGIGSCSTMESKYRWRNAAKACPECGCETIIKGKAEYGGGWLCFAKKGGCGAKFKDGDSTIESQQVGRVENTDIADQRNTVRKMSKKRAHIDATLTVTGASEHFTQDIDDFGLDPIVVNVKASVSTQNHPTNGAPIVVLDNPVEWKFESGKSKGMTIGQVFEKVGLTKLMDVASDPKSRAKLTENDLANLDAFLMSPPENGVTFDNDDIPFIGDDNL